jgi:AsmA-like protein
MKRVLLIVGIAGATLILLAAAAAVILIKPETLKNQALARLSAASGYTVTAGPASLALGWRGAGVQVRRLTATAPDSSTVIAVDNLAAYVKLLPLLQHRVVLQHLRLDRPTYVLRNVAGPPEVATPSAASRAAPAAVLDVDSWSIADGTYRQIDAGREDVTLSGIDLDGALHQDARAGAVLEAHGRIRHSVFLAGPRPWPVDDVKTEAKVRITPAADSLAVDMLDLAIGEIHGRFSGGYARRPNGWAGGLRGGVDRESWDKFQALLAPVAASFARFEIAGNIGLSEIECRRTEDGKNDVSGSVDLDDLSVRMAGAPVGLSNFQAKIRFTPEAVAMEGGRGIVAGSPLTLDATATGTEVRQVHAHVVTSVSGATVSQLVPQGAPFTLGAGTIHLDLKLETSFPGRSLPRVNGRIGLEGLGGTANGLAFSEVNGTVDMSGRTADISNVRAKVGRSDVTLAGQVPDVLQPSLDFTLVSNHLDVDELNSSPPSTPAASSTKPMRSPVGIPGQGSLEAGTVRFQGQDYQNVKAKVRLDANGILLNDLTGTLHGGQISGNVRIAPQAGHWAYDGAFTAKGVEAGSVLATWVPGAQVLDGRMNGTANLSGEAGTGADIQKTLSMIGEAQLSGGAFRNLNGLESLGKVLHVSDLSADRWPIQDLTTHFEIKNGAAVLKGLHVVQAGLDWNLGGQVGFDGSLNMTGTLRARPEQLKLPAQAAAITPYLMQPDGRIAVDFKMGGKATAPALDMNWDALLAQAAGHLTRGVVPGVKDSLKTPAVLDKFKNLLGGKKGGG